MLQRQSVGAFAIPKKAANAARRKLRCPRTPQSCCRYSIREDNSSCCTPDFWSDVHPASRSGDTRSSVSRQPSTPGSPCVKHWWKGAATLQIRALHAIGTASEPPASQAFKPAPYSPPVHVLTVCSAPVNRVQSESICGPIISMIIGLQRLSSMPPHGLGMA